MGLGDADVAVARAAKHTAAILAAGAILEIEGLLQCVLCVLGRS
jgi:hypothetical protein